MYLSCPRICRAVKVKFFWFVANQANRRRTITSGPELFAFSLEDDSRGDDAIVPLATLATVPGYVVDDMLVIGMNAAIVSWSAT